MKTITYIDALNTALTADLPDEIKDKLTALRDQIAKRNSGERKPTKNQIANQGLAEVIAEVLQNASEPLTVTEIMARSEVLGALSNQKVSALLRGMGDKVTKVVDKRVSKFTLA